MTKEQYTKLNDLLNKADFDLLIATLATIDYLVNNYYNKTQSDALINNKELLANKATDFSVVDDTKYPTTKAVSERLLNLPIAELNNHTLREVFEGGNLVVNGDFNLNGTNWVSSGVIFNGYAEFILRNDFSYIYQEYDISNFALNDKIWIRIEQGNAANQPIFTNGFNPNTPSSTPYEFPITSFPTAQINIDQLGTSMMFALYLYPTLETGKVFLDNLSFINQRLLGINNLTKEQMDYWFSVYQALLVSDTNAIFSLLAPKQQEAWLTPTLTGATSTYIRYRKDTLGTVIVEGNITVTTAGTNFTLPVGYRPLFAYTVGILTFNTDGTVVSSATGTQSISVRFTGA